MTSHPPEPPAQWPPPFPEDRQRPGIPAESPDGGGRRPAAPDERPPGSRPRYPADLRANGMPPPLADCPPERGYRPAPGHPSGIGSGPVGDPGYPDLPDYPQNTYSPRDPSGGGRAAGRLSGRRIPGGGVPGGGRRLVRGGRPGPPGGVPPPRQRA